jgi:hypothetical protein
MWLLNCLPKGALAGALVLLVASAVSGVVHMQAAQPTPPKIAADAALSRGSGPFAGVWTSIPSTQEAAALDDLGVGWARVTVEWSSVEPSPGTFRWTDLDRAMTLAAGDGRRSVLALVRENPAWAASSRCTLTTDAERQQLAAFMGTLATRYRGVVWQLYNEMDNTSEAADTEFDLGGCFGTVGADRVATASGRVSYAAALEAASGTIRAADPTAALAAGGVASGGFTDIPGGNFDRGFLPGVLAQLKEDDSLNSLDYVAVHFYSSQAGTFSAAGTDLLGRVAQLRQDLSTAGLTSGELKPIISDELGYTGSIGTSTSNQADPFNLAQRDYVPKLLARAAAANLRAAFWFWLRDAPSGLGADNAYGLEDLTGAPKPAYLALRYFVGQVSRLDQFVAALDFSGQASTLEGYQFTTTDGRSLQIVWGQPASPSFGYSYSPSCPIAAVTDAVGAPTPFDGNTNVVVLSTEPRYVFCAPTGADVSGE